MGFIHFLARVHWAGRLTVLILSSLLLSWPMALIFPVFLWETHFFMGLIVSSLLLDRWFGLGFGGLLGLRLSWRNLRLIALTVLALCLLCLLIVLTDWAFLQILSGSFSGDAAAEILFSLLAALSVIIPGLDLNVSMTPGFVSGISPYQILFVACHAVGEELLFRGIPLLVLARRFGWPTAITVVTVAFTAVHFTYFAPGIIATANLVFFGLFTALAIERSGSIWVPIVLHSGWNLLAFFKLGLPLGGAQLMFERMQSMTGNHSQLAEETICNNDWYALILGAPGVGAEGGLLMTAFLLGLIFLFVPRLERLRDPVLAAREFRRRLREASLAAVHGFRA